MQVHGGDIYNNKVKLDFSANINPAGMPQSVESAAKSGVELSGNYPDIGCSKLKREIAIKEGVPVEWIVCGNGAAELIFQFAFAIQPKRALLIQPTFAEYAQALEAVDCKLEYGFLSEEDGYKMTDRVLELIHPGLDVMFLCNPNNPTGETIPTDLLRNIIQKCQECQIRLVVDECFQEFLLEKDQDSVIGLVDTYDFLFVLKAFTKMYGMAGLRLGYALTSDGILRDKMKRMSQPWNVSIPAQMAGIAACREVEFAIHSRDLIQQEKSYVQGQIEQLGYRVYGSKANYIFFQGPDGLYEYCLKQAILIRSCSNYPGLSEGYYRIQVKNRQENLILLRCLEQFMAQQY